MAIIESSSSQHRSGNLFGIWGEEINCSSQQRKPCNCAFMHSIKIEMTRGDEEGDEEGEGGHYNLLLQLSHLVVHC